MSHSFTANLVDVPTAMGTGPRTCIAETGNPARWFAAGTPRASRDPSVAQARDQEHANE
jgi:hypothetical protein